MSRLVRASPQLRRLLRTLVFSLPAFANVLVVLLLDFFVFAIIGEALFSGIREAPNGSGAAGGSGGFVNGDANFESFGVAIITLVRACTGENFDMIMHGAWREGRTCGHGRQRRRRGWGCLSRALVCQTQCGCVPFTCARGADVRPRAHAPLYYPFLPDSLSSHLTHSPCSQTSSSGGRTAAPRRPPAWRGRTRGGSCPGGRTCPP